MQLTTLFEQARNEHGRQVASRTNDNVGDIFRGRRVSGAIIVIHSDGVSAQNADTKSQQTISDEGEQAHGMPRSSFGGALLYCQPELK